MAQTYTKNGKRENVNNDRMSEGIISEINKQRKDHGQKGVGEYTENVGGGTPGTGGRGGMHGNFLVFDDPDDPEAIKAKEEGKKVRYRQPRDENGQFTYNSANAKGITTKNSRGHTPLPFLAGVDLTFIKKGSSFQYDEVEIQRDENGNPIKDSKGNEVTNERMVRIISSIDMTADELATACRKYFKHEGGFLGVIGTAVTKKGSPSKVEKTGTVGKTGEVDLSSKATSTQQAVNAASQNKDVAGLQAEDAARKAAFAKHLRKQQAKQAPASQPTQPVQPTNTVGAGAGAGAGTNTNPSGTSTNNNLNAKNNNSANDFDSNEISRLKSADQQSQINWVKKNADKFKKASQETGLTTGQIFHLILTGQVKNWDTSKWGNNN